MIGEAYIPECGDMSVHMFHHYSGPVTTHCNGQTACGSRVHEPHDVVSSSDHLWCGGLCTCARSGKPEDQHGPGRHK